MQRENVELRARAQRAELALSKEMRYRSELEHRVTELEAQLTAMGGVQTPMDAE